MVNKGGLKEPFLCRTLIKERLRLLLLPCVLLLAASMYLTEGCALAGRGLKCSSFDAVGAFLSSDILECSGMAASRTQNGILWVHNDSGDEAKVFAVTEQGALRGVYVLKGFTALDWEDIALGPCASGSTLDCLYVGDIGDNAKVRTSIRIYRIQEPRVPLGGPPAYELIDEVEVFESRYPDGPHDAETLIIDPDTATPYVITKDVKGRTAVYRFPKAPRGLHTTVLEKITKLPRVAHLTGGDVSPDGSRIILRNYLTLFEYSRRPGQAFPEIFSNKACTINLPQEPQGEALAIGPSGADVYTTSEGFGASIHRARCTAP